MSTAADRPRVVETPEQLQRVMGTAFAPSPQQWEAISAPLSPAVVVAGAGSGKTTLMAARVVYLVVTGQVRPEEVLGLTFTTKAASELRRKILDALVQAGALGAPSAATTRTAEEPLEPTVATYNAYAANLLTEHGLRIGHEPDTRVITDAARYQLGARVVDRFTGDVEHLSDHPATVIQNLLALDGAMSEHLVDEAAVRRVDAEARRGFELAREAEVAGKNRKGHREACEKAMFAIDRRAEVLQLVAGYRRLKRDLGLMDFSDQIELGARLAGRAARGGGRRAVEVQGRAARRVPGHLRGPGPDAVAALLRPGGRGRTRRASAVGGGTRSPPWATPTRRSTAGGGPRSPTSSTSTTPSPPPTGRGRSVPPHREPSLRPADPGDRQPAGRGPLRALRPGGAAGGRRDRRRGHRHHAVHLTHADELAALVEQVRAAHEAGTAEKWSDIGVLTRDNAHAADVFDALGAAQVPVEIVGTVRACCACPRWPRWSRRCTCCTTSPPTRPCSPC